MGHGGHHVINHIWQRPWTLTLLLPDLVCIEGDRVETTLLVFTGLLDEDGWMWASCRHEFMGNTVCNFSCEQGIRLLTIWDKISTMIPNFHVKRKWPSTIILLQGSKELLQSLNLVLNSMKMLICGA